MKFDSGPQHIMSASRTLPARRASLPMPRQLRLQSTWIVLWTKFDIALFWRTRTHSDSHGLLVMRWTLLQNQKHPLPYIRYPHRCNRQKELITASFIMKSILSGISLVYLAASAFAQNAAIGYPPQGLSVSPGSILIVQVERPVSFWHIGIPWHCLSINDCFHRTR